MTTPAFFQSYMQMVAAIRICTEKQLIAPALVLIYSTIDSYAWAVSGKGLTTRKRFEAFVSEWLMRDGKLSCAPIDLYAARCAVLHTLTSESDLSASGSAKRIGYSWGTANATTLGAALREIDGADLVTIQIEHLANALFDAMADIVDRAETDPELDARLLEAGGMHYARLEIRTVDEFLEAVKKSHPT